MTLGRREFLSAAASVVVCRGATTDRLVAHSYVFTQAAAARKVRSVEEVDSICRDVAAAGFRMVEFMSEFFEPPNAERTLSALEAHRLTVPIIYVGGAMHTSEGVEDTIARAMQIAEAARSGGMRYINHNPQPKGRGQRKTEDELATQARGLNELGETLRKNQVQLLYHTHDPEMAENAREWRHVLQHTAPELVSFCMDTHWIFRGGQDPLKLLREAGSRTRSLHLRNSVDGVWSESFGPGEVDYARVAALLREMRIEPLLVVELAREKGTPVTLPLRESLRRSREFTQKTFG